jgi:hypothetical protein
VRLDKGTYTFGAAAVGAAVVLGALAGRFAGPSAGVLTALAGLVSAALWAVASDRRTKAQARSDLLEDARRKLAPLSAIMKLSSEGRAAIT